MQDQSHFLEQLPLHYKQKYQLIFSNYIQNYKQFIRQFICIIRIVNIWYTYVSNNNSLKRSLGYGVTRSTKLDISSIDIYSSQVVYFIKNKVLLPQT